MTTPPNNSAGINPPASVLVTGGTGFVGAYVIRDLLNAGYRVSAIRRNKKLPAFIEASIMEKAEWIEGDILDPVLLDEAMKNTDAVVHSAAIVSFNRADRQQLFTINIEGTANVVNAALDNNIQKFIYVSSVAAVAKKKDGSLVSEDLKWQEDKLHSNYAISKHHAEMEVWRGIAEGLSAVIVNPSTILGFGDWNSSSSAIFKNVFDEFGWYTNGATGFVDVEDVSRAIVTLLATNIHSERFILNGENWTYRKLLNTIADGLGKKRPSREATPFLASIAWRLEKVKSLVTGKKSLLTRESSRAARSNTKYDNSKLLKALPGFSFTQLDDTIRKACEQYRQKQHPL